MLVLSRRYNQRLLIPQIQTSIQVVAIKPGVVRLGIDAPADITILREEVTAKANNDERPARLSGSAEAAAAVPATASAPLAKTEAPTPEDLRELRHAVRNHLNTATLGMALLRCQVQANQPLAADATIGRIEHELSQIHSTVDRFTQRALQGDKDKKPSRRRVGKALVVEDDRNERELLAGFLRMAGWEVATAENGEFALQQVQTELPDVILIDMVMPHADGVTTIQALRRDPRLDGVKIFAMTGHSPNRFKIDPSKAGIDRWLSKPLNPQALLRDLDLALAG